MRLFGWLRGPKYCTWVIRKNPLTEPGISDVDGGRWARMLIECTTCYARRRVWKWLPLNDPLWQREPCPSIDCEPEYERQERHGSNQG